MLSANAQFSWNQVVAQRIKNATKRVVVGMGIPKAAQYPNGTKVEDVAFKMEFGDGHTPPRPFMRSTIAQEKWNWAESARKKLSKVAVGRSNGSARTALKALGEEVKQDVIKTIDELTAPPLKPATIKAKEKKGSPMPEKPLIDTGRLKGSFRVVEETEE